MKFLRKYKYDFLFGLLLGLAIFAFLFVRNRFGFLSNREEFERFIESFGLFGPLAMILTIITEVVVAPVPGFVPSISAGFIFGTLQGALYSYIGNIIGTIILFFTARHFGRYLILKFIKEDKLDHYELLIEKRQHFLFAFYVFPILPLDVITAAFGLSNVHFMRFLSFISIGYVFHVAIISLFGNFLANLYF